MVSRVGTRIAWSTPPGIAEVIVSARDVIQEPPVIAFGSILKPCIRKEREINTNIH
jgi:hypothetical protein